MKTSWVLMLFAALSCGCVTGRKAALEQESTTAGPAGPNDKLVCRKEEVIGSHMRRKVCAYETERKRQREAARDALGHTPGTETDPTSGI